MIKKKLFTLMSVAIAACLTLSACGTSKSSSKSNENDNKKVTINYWVCWSPGSETEKNSKAMFKKYESTHPNVTIKYSLITYDMAHDKLVTAASAKNTPDMSWALPEWIGEFNNMGMLLDLTDYYNKSGLKNSIYPNVMNTMTVKDKVIGLPYQLTIRALLVHKSQTDAAGIKTIPATFDDMLKLGDVYKNSKKYPFGLCATSVRTPQELIGYFASNGLKVATEMSDGKYKNTWKDNPAQLAKAAEVFQYYKDLTKKGIVSPNSKAWGWEDEDTNFATGQYMMEVTGNWMSEREATNPKEMADVTIAAPPYKQIPATYMETNPTFIYNSTKNPKEVFDFAAFISGKEYQKAVFPVTSPRNDVVSSIKWSKDFMNIAKTGVSFPPVTLGGITTAMTDSLGKTLQNNEKPSTVAAWLSDQINKSLKQNGEYSEK